MFLAVLRIHDILVWIRIRGSMPLTNGFGSGSCYFRHWPSRCQKKLICLKNFSVYYFLEVHLHHFSKEKSQNESQNIFAMMIGGSGSIPLTNGTGTGRPKNMWIRNTGFWASRILTSKKMKPCFLLFCSLFIFDVNGPLIRIFCWRLEGHWRKEQDPEPDPLVKGTDPRIQI